MIGSYIKTSGRSMLRNKLFSSINIVGLAISMSVGLIMIGVLVDISSYDKFHEKHDRIYRVISQRQHLGQDDGNFNATTSRRSARAIQETFAGIDDVAVLHRGFEGDMKVGEKVLPLTGFYANEGVLRVFSFPLLKGNPATALKAPFSVVLTELTARKLFGDDEPIGKTVIMNQDKAYTVTGVMKDVPKFSHMKFDMLGSMSTRDIAETASKNEWSWDNVWSTWVYLELPEQADLNAVQSRLNTLSRKEDPSTPNTHIQLALQPLDNIMTGENLNNQIGTILGSTLLWVFAGLSFVVILSACFNYTNLSVARSLRRSREVGIRKVIGALKHHVAMQFVMEAVIISVLSGVVAFVLFLLLRPYFINLQPDLQQLLVLEPSPFLVGCFFVFSIVVGLAAGIFPALFFSRINAIQVLKNATSVRLFRKVTLRKVLIVFQYSVSLMLITGTLIIFKEYKHFVSFDLGFSTANIINIRLQGNSAERLKKELRELPEVTDMAEAWLVTGIGHYAGEQVRNPHQPEDSALVYFNRVDEHYIPFLNLELLAGRNFMTRPDSSEEREVIVNQQVLKRFQLAEQNPQRAIGEVLHMAGKELKIIGVIKDFRYGKPGNNTPNEVMLRHAVKDAGMLHVKIAGGDNAATYARIESLWKKIDPVHTFSAKFYDDTIKESFSGISASVKLAGFVSLLAICIASMGLLGMVVFTTETRLKEISIRKVLGAGEGKLMFLLGRGFFMLLAIATFIAIPSTYLFCDAVLLKRMANPAPLGVGEGLVGVLSVMAIALVMIGSQTLKVARSNPAEVLKNE
ncbi:ABC transporter permease [Chryseolinea sp. Jin1]|uniref:ABC transporter permease n=2 Tax=Chryseolinea lacunae TaxID=2801331 RepID=A0ABS1KW35_9BACT|nr:ABC transporter permease [Chryseolinea lacunae]